MPLGLIAIRALHFWSVAILLGGGGFLRLVGAREVRSGSRILRAASVGAAVTGVAWFVWTFINVTGAADSLLSEQTWADFITSPFGAPWAARLALCVAAMALLPLKQPLPFVMLGAAFAIDQAGLGHAAAGVGGAGLAVVLSYVVHVLAAFGWTGALTMLVAALRTPGAARDGLALFSTIGLLMVAAILASGCLNAAFHMSHPAELITTDYGRIVSVKITLFAAMLVLAALNRREGRRHAINRRAVAIGVACETTLGLLVLIAAAALGITAPAA